MPTLPRPLLTLAMPDLIVIPNWDRDFENAKSRTVERTSFFCVQNHFDGKKIRRLQNLPKSLEIYGAFHAICAVASKCWYRGVLLDHDGPIDAFDLSAKTGFPPDPLKKAIEQLAKPGVQLLEIHQIEHRDGKWVLPDTVRTWAIPQNLRRKLKDSGDTAGTREDSGEPKPPRPSIPRSESPAAPPQTSALPGDTASPPESPGVPAGPKKRREGNGTEVPPTVPPGGREIEDLGILITEPEVAKRFICEKILGGKNPARAWGGEAQHLLADLCRPPGLPLQEILDVAEYWAHPASDDIPELKNRPPMRTERLLMEYWHDDADRARDFKKKYSGGGKNGKKPEPPAWREFFRWHHSNPGIVLPSSFWLLSEDQRKNYDREFEKFQADAT